MSDYVTEFVQEAPGVVTAESEQEGEFIHVYRGELADVDTPVRFLTVAPGIVDEDTAAAFTRVAGQWENASTHPNIVPVYDRGDTPRAWLAVGEVTGKPLDAAQPNLSPSESKAIVRDAAEAIRNAALYNTVHGALRPDHLWVVPDGDDVTALVDDWGLRQATAIAAGAFQPGPFTAPELLDDPTSDRRTDVYGLGAIAYYVLTGRPPIDGTDLAAAIQDGDVTPPSDHDASLPTEVDDVVLQALATDPAGRHDSAYAFKQAFSQAYTFDGSQTDKSTTTDATVTRHPDQAQSADAESKPADASDSLVSRRTVAGALAVGAVGAVGAGGVWLATTSDENDGGGPVDTPDPGTATPTVEEQPLVAGSGSSRRGSFTVIGPGVVEADQQFRLIGGVAEASTEQFGGFEIYVDEERVRKIGLQEGQAALFSKQIEANSTGIREFAVEVRFVNGDRGVDEQVGQARLDTRVRESAPTQIPEIIRETGSSDRGTFEVQCPSLVPGAAQLPVTGQVTEAPTEQFGGFEVYVDDELVRDVGLQEGESARFGRLYDMPESGSRSFTVEVRFVNGDMGVDERVGQATLNVEAL